MFKSPVPYIGSKGKMLQYILPSIPVDSEVYNEPFCGSCSALLGVLQTRPNHFKHIIASDMNKDLIAVWKSIQADAVGFNEGLVNFASSYCAEDIDNLVPSTDEESMYKYYISLHCVPYRKVGCKIDKIKYMSFIENNLHSKLDNIRGISELIQPVDFMCCSYKDSMKKALSYNLKSFCFADPPYKESQLRLTNWYSGNNFIDLCELHELVSAFDNYVVSHSEDEVFYILFDDFIKHKITTGMKNRVELYACK